MGELVQGRMGPDGPVVLITLPCPVLRVGARMTPGTFGLQRVGPLALGRARAAAMLRALGLPVAGRFAMSGNVPPGGGAGASTAALVALARAAGADTSRIASACIAVEGASDPLMLARPERVLWASRQGRIVADLPPLPAMEVLAGFWGPSQSTDPRDNDFPDVSDLVAEWPAACRDATRIARIASESARRVLALRGPESDPTERFAAAMGAAGFAVGHTGPARALLFRPGAVPAQGADRLRRAGYAHVVRYRIGGKDA